MKFSIWPNASSPWDENRDFVRSCEALGWGGVWFEDHLIPGSKESGPVFEVWSTIAALAEATETVTIGTLVCSLTYRHPAILASAALTCDQISGGRVVLGIGAGWQVKEHKAYGLELGTGRERSDRLWEGAAVIRSLLDNAVTDFTGDYYQITGASREPKAVTGRLPLLIAGKGERRTLATVAEFADRWNGWVDPVEMVAKRSVLADHCEAFGRDISSIECSTQAVLAPSLSPSQVTDLKNTYGGRAVLGGSSEEMLDYAGALADAGTDEFILADWAFVDRSERAEAFERFWTEVASAL